MGQADTGWISWTTTAAARCGSTCGGSANRCESRRYLQTGGILDDFAAGHTKAVAAAHYADIDAHNALHDQAVEDGLRQALQAALPAPVTATADGEPLGVPGENPPPLTPAQHRAAASGDQDVFLASCATSTPHRSPARPATAARPRSGDAWNARTRCSPNGTCPASPPSRRSFEDQREELDGRNGRPATARPITG